MRKGKAQWGEAAGGEGLQHLSSLSVSELPFTSEKHREL